MKILVGSTNPVKLEASREAFALVDGSPSVREYDVDSGVSDQPTDDSEAIEGAKNRAREVNKREKGDFAVGLEGSVSDTKYGMFLTGWAFLLDSDASSYIGGGGRLMLPEPIAESIRKGQELGPLMDELTGRNKVKEGVGAIGVFTNGIITRQQAYRNALIFALAKYMNPQLYR